MGRNCIVEKGAEIMEDCILGDSTSIGPNCVIGPGCIFKGHNMMGSNVHIYTTSHYYDNIEHKFSGRTGANSVIIGENVWLGYGVIILPGVIIGDNVIIGAGSVVTKNIPCGVLAAGNPCVVKKLLIMRNLRNRLVKILHINCNYVGTTLHQLMIEELERQGIENEVFVPVYDKNIAVIKPNKNVYVSECFHKWDRIIFDYKQKKIIQAIEERYDISEFDLIHAYTLFTDGNAARILSEKYGIPYVVAVRNTDVNDFFKKMVYLRNRGVRTMMAGERVFFLSDAYRKRVFEKYIPSKEKLTIFNKTDIVPNGIDNFWLDRIYYERDFDSIINRIKRKELRLVYAGGIDNNKNISTSVLAIKDLISKGWSIDFDIIGKIKEQKVFNQFKELPYCHYHASSPKEKLIEFYRNADIFIMPSHYESFGLVYAEAMSQGLPVIYTKGQGFDGQFLEGEIGFAVESISPQDISNAIEKIAANYKTMSLRCLKRCRKFSWSSIVKQYMEIYNIIMNS